MVATAMFSYMQARYGIRGIFLSGKPWRWMLLVVAFVYGMLGGFRGQCHITCPDIFYAIFYRRVAPDQIAVHLAIIGLLGMLALVPLAPHLPHSAQRSLSFLPLNIDAAVQRDAEQSADWRFEMWKALLPEVPQHLLLGKGYAISRRDIDSLTGTDAAIHTFSGFDANQYMALAGTYHNGPFTVLMTFGIWGVITIIWFWITGIWVLYRNYRYGDPALRTVNTFLLVVFVMRILFFLTIFGDFGYRHVLFRRLAGVERRLEWRSMPSHVGTGTSNQ